MAAVFTFLRAFISSTTYTIVVPEPMPIYFASRGKWSSTARLAALRLEVSMSAIGLLRGVEKEGEDAKSLVTCEYEAEFLILYVCLMNVSAVGELGLRSLREFVT